MGHHGTNPISASQPLGRCPQRGVGREEFVGDLGGPMGEEGRPRDGRGRRSQRLAEMEQGQAMRAVGGLCFNLLWLKLLC